MAGGAETEPGEERALRTGRWLDGGRGAVAAGGAMEALARRGHGQARLIGSRGAGHGRAGASQWTVEAGRARGLKRVRHRSVGKLAHGIIRRKGVRQIVRTEVVVHVVDVDIHFQIACRLRAHHRQIKD